MLSWDRKCVLLVDFLPAGTTINAERYYETLKKLGGVVQNWGTGMLSNDLSSLHDNVRKNVASQTVDLLQNFGWNLVQGTDCAPSPASLCEGLYA